MNMTVNLFGRYLQHALVHGETYVPQPPPPDPLQPASKVGLVRHVLGYVEFLRDPMGYMCSFMMLPPAERYRAAYYGVAAEGRLIRVFFALRCYRLDHGRLPDTLDALTPQYLKTIPLDPFNGKPMGYEPSGKEPRIWSVGVDGVTHPLHEVNYPLLTYVEHGGDDTIIFLRFHKDGSAKADAGQPH